MNQLLTSDYVMVAILGTLAVILMFFPPSKDKKLAGYDVTMRLLAMCYMSTAMFFVLTSFRPTGQVLPIVFLLTLHIQAHLLGIMHLNYINPEMLTTAYVWKNMRWMVLLLFTYNLIRIFYEPVPIYTLSDLCGNLTNLEVALRGFWMIAFMLTLVDYSIIFFREERKYHDKTLDFYPEEMSTYMFIIKSSFALYILMSAVALVEPFLVSSRIGPFLNYFLLGAMIMIGIFALMYPRFFPRIKAVVYEKKKERASEPVEISASSGEMTWTKVRAAIIGSGLYMDEGVTLQTLADQLGIERNNLSAMVHANEKVNFNSFINGLRIERAKDMMREHPGASLSDISEAVGYATPSNFSRQFKQITGITPADYRKQLS